MLHRITGGTPTPPRPESEPLPPLTTGERVRTGVTGAVVAGASGAGGYHVATLGSVITFAGAIMGAEGAAIAYAGIGLLVGGAALGVVGVATGAALMGMSVLRRQPFLGANVQEPDPPSS